MELLLKCGAAKSRSQAYVLRFAAAVLGGLVVHGCNLLTLLTVGDMQKEGGVTQESVHRMVDDPNNVLVIHHFDDVEKAESFFARDDLREAFERSGVQGQPRIGLFE